MTPDPVKTLADQKHKKPRRPINWGEVGTVALSWIVIGLVMLYSMRHSKETAMSLEPPGTSEFWGWLAGIAPDLGLVVVAIRLRKDATNIWLWIGGAVFIAMMMFGNVNNALPHAGWSNIASNPGWLFAKVVLFAGILPLLIAMMVESMAHRPKPTAPAGTELAPTNQPNQPNAANQRTNEPAAPSVNVSNPNQPANRGPRKIMRPRAPTLPAAPAPTNRTNQPNQLTTEPITHPFADLGGWHAQTNQRTNQPTARPNQPANQPASLFDLDDDELYEPTEPTTDEREPVGEDRWVPRSSELTETMLNPVGLSDVDITSVLAYKREGTYAAAGAMMKPPISDTAMIKRIRKAREKNPDWVAAMLDSVDV